MVRLKDVLPEVVAGIIAIIVIVFDGAIVAYELVNGKVPTVPDVFSNLTFAVIAVYFTQQAQARTAQRIGEAVAQANTQTNRVANGSIDSKPVS